MFPARTLRDVGAGFDMPAQSGISKPAFTPDQCAPMFFKAKPSWNESPRFTSPSAT